MNTCVHILVRVLGGQSPCGSTSWFSRYRRNSERTVREKSSVVQQCHISPCKYSDNRPGENSNARYDDTYSSTHSAVENATIAARYGVNTCCPLIKPHAELLQQLPRTCTPWAATSLSSAAVAKTSNASYCTHSTSTYVRHPQKNIRSQLGADISTPDVRKPFRDRDSGIFFAEIWSDPGCIKCGF